MSKPYIGLPVQYIGSENPIAAVITAINPADDDNVQTVNLTLFPSTGGMDTVTETTDWELIPVDLPE
jgi:hypothetical protein